MSRRHAAVSDIAQPTSCALLLESVARGLRSGLSLSVSLTRVCSPDDASGPDDWTTPVPSTDVDDRIAEAVRRHLLGQPLVTSLDLARDSCRHDESLRLTLAVLRTAAAHGGTAAEALDRTAATLRQHAALASDARTHAAPARLSATVLTLAPILFSACAAVLDAKVRHVLVATPVGWLCLASGLALSLVGRRWMARLVEDAR